MPLEFKAVEKIGIVLRNSKRKATRALGAFPCDLELGGFLVRAEVRSFPPQSLQNVPLNGENWS